VKLPQLYKSVHAVDPKSKSEFVSILKVWGVRMGTVDIDVLKQGTVLTLMLNWTEVN
jgi:hypothetical protein